MVHIHSQLCKPTMNPSMKNMNRSNLVHKAAISINNTAVTLLSKGFIRESMTTLKDSLHLMKMASQSREKYRLDHEEEEAYMAAIHHAQQCSSVMMMNMSDTASRGLHGSPDEVIVYLIIVKPIDSQTLAHELVEKKNGDFFHQVPMPIFIDPTDGLEDEDSTFDFESAIILYNYGLSHSLLANRSKDNQTIQNSLRQSSLRVFELAETIIDEMFDNCHDDSLIETCIQETLMFRILLTRSLIQSNLDLNQPAPADVHRNVLKQLLALVEQRHRFCPSANELRIAPTA